MEPGLGFGIARRAPITAGRERSTGSYLGSIWQTGTLELAGLKEADEKHLQPVLDFAERIFPALGIRDTFGPYSVVLVAPGLICKERYLARSKAKAGKIVEVKIL